MKPPAKLTTAQEAAFAAFWAAYPRKDGKAAAREVFARLIGAGPAGGVDPAFLVRAAQRHADQCRERQLERTYIPHAKTWLRDRRFEDEAFQDPPEVPAGPTFEPPEAEDLWWPHFRDAGMDRGAYDRWIRPCRIETGSDGQVTEMWAPHAFHAQWLETRLDHLIRRALGHMPEIEVMP
ncbi:hypothetical protein [uncultured Rhodospira sp.]|uniref:hypothetical protein n=1 Tax=uncultured Rhodospira sp. TaxID=1936189 RepID=UPI002635E6F2|nr:hypothetical protein [uncultured Rhodospira sp.]